jgi:hypothetical protein
LIFIIVSLVAVEEAVEPLCRQEEVVVVLPSANQVSAVEVGLAVQLLGEGLEVGIPVPQAQVVVEQELRTGLPFHLVEAEVEVHLSRQEVVAEEPPSVSLVPVVQAEWEET